MKEQTEIPESGTQGVYAEQVNLTYTQAGPSLVAGWLVALGLCAVLWGETQARLLLSWFALLSVVTLGRAGLVMAFRHLRPGAPGIATWSAAYTLGVALGGITWGLLGLFYGRFDASEYRVFVLFGLAGIAAGALPSNAAIIRNYAVFLALSLVPLVLVLLFHGDTLHVTMAALVSLYAGMLFVTASHYRASILNSLSLVRQLSSANTALEAEVAARERAERSLEEQGQYLSAVLDNVLEGVVTIDERGTIESFNKGAEAIFGLSSAEARGQNVKRLMPSLVREQLDGHLRSYPETGQARIIGLGREVIGLRHGGEEFPAKLTVSEMRSGDQRAFIGLVRDMSERKRTETELERYRDQLERLSYVDALTQIANRRRCDEHLQREWLRARRSGQPLALVLLDIDHFKGFNDRYGQAEADACLKQVGRALAGCVRRPGDLASRYGGETFACILPDTGLENATTLAKGMCKAVSALDIPHAASSTAPRVTLSAGVAVIIPSSDLDTGALVRLADEALYQAKEGGHNQVRNRMRV